MNVIKRLLPVLSFVALAGAAEPAASPTTGKVLILDNERAVEGEIVLQGEQYSIRRGKGEMTVPAAKTLRLCAGWDDALSFMKSRANLHDPDERLRLARWCEKHDLVEHALREVNAALDMRPGHQGARQLQAFLEKTLAMRHTERPDSPARTISALPLVDIGSESVALFNNKVHAILMNTCIQCHSQGRGTHFQLTRGYEGGLRAALQRNLAAVIAQIDAKQPALSPLLIKAAAAHGKSDQSPLPGGRKSVPYKTLETWVHMVVSNNPHLRELNAQSATTEKPAVIPPSTPEPRRLPPSVTEEKPAPPAVREVERFGTPTPAVAESARVVPVNVQTPAPPPALPRAPVTTPPPRPVPDPADPFDPAVFNQQLRRDP